MAGRHKISLKQLLPAFKRIRVLVVGDLMLDEFVWGRVSRISPEAPVPVVWAESESVMPGGAANVANNIRALGGEVAVAGVIGEDRWAATLMDELALRRIDAHCVIHVPRPTTVKSRVIAHNQQVVRVDREKIEPLSPETIKHLSCRIAEHIEEIDALIIEDYGKGTVTPQLLRSVIPIARKANKLVTVDPKQEHFALYRGVTAVTPNRFEAGQAVGRELLSGEDVAWAGKRMMKRLACEGVLITLGEDGMYLLDRSGIETRIPTFAQEVFDVAGAGDTVIAVFTLALAGGATMARSAEIANAAAGVVVGKLGVAAALPEELAARLNRKRPKRRIGDRCRSLYGHQSLAQ